MDTPAKFIALASAALNARRKSLLFILLVRERQDQPRGKSCYTSQSRLAAEIDCSLSTLKRDLVWARNNGIVSTTLTAAGSVCNYTVHLPALQALPQAIDQVMTRTERELRKTIGALGKDPSGVAGALEQMAAHMTRKKTCVK